MTNTDTSRSGDLVERLHYTADHCSTHEIDVGLVYDAADRIEALEAENERLREALEQFLALIEHQYSGSREAMNALQEADNFASATLAKLENPDA